MALQDIHDGTLQRGRTNIAADFNLDGVIDLFVGNPGDTSRIFQGREQGGRVRFIEAQVLLVDEIAWGGAAFDYDNDGDYDLYVSVGGNESIGPDYMFKNMWLETGELRFEDVTAETGISGPVPAGNTDPIPVASGNGITADYDRDGDVDLFVSVNLKSVSLPELRGRNILWRNNGDGTFTDVTESAGLAETAGATRHSTFLDIDNDGDMDLFENNHLEASILYRNLLVETGTPQFEDVTEEFSPPGEDLNYPHASFVSAAADFDNDGWEDLMVFFRGQDRPEKGSPYQAGHALFLNQAGEGFVNVARESGLNAPFIADDGVMGCQVGDVNYDGTPDIYIGNGGPTGGQLDQLFVSEPFSPQQPSFLDLSDQVNFEPRKLPGISYPTFPYRTHGTAIVDLDGAGGPEIMVVNGGPARGLDDVREPNRAFGVRVGGEAHYLWVRPDGDGVNVSRDAIGTRVKVEVKDDAGVSWTVHKTLFGGSAFNAQNGFSLFFGLLDAVTIESLTVLWPDGTSEVLTDGLALDSRMVVSY